MLLTNSTGHFVCHFCQSHQLADTSKASADEIKTTEQGLDIFCPGCMDENELKQGLIDKIEIGFCPECFGFLLDSESLGQYIRYKRAQYKGPEDRPTPIAQDQLANKRDCPRCHLPMDVHPYYGPGNAVIDSCHRCKTVWLDQGEVTSIIQAPGLR